jgi:hypothetical protein
MLGGQPSTLEVAGLRVRASAAWTAPQRSVGFQAGAPQPTPRNVHDGVLIPRREQ